MTTCWACGKDLDPAWKFCIHCGVPTEKHAPHTDDVESDAGIPSAIRPDGGTASASLSPLAVFGWIMAGIGAALLIGGAVLYFVLR